jgi:hypothetical protein
VQFWASKEEEEEEERRFCILVRMYNQGEPGEPDVCWRWRRATEIPHGTKRSLRGHAAKLFQLDPFLIVYCVYPL